MVRFIVVEEDAGTRLDVFLAAKIDVLSRTSIRKLCDQGDIHVNNNAQKANYKLHSADNVVVDFDATALGNIPKIDLPVLYEDDDCVVINKPIGVLTHSKGAFNPEATVATWLKPKLKNFEGERAGIVHRLDRATSGVVIAAKTPKAQKWLQKQFSERKAKKTYVAIVEGVITPQTALIDMPIERNPKQPATFRTHVNGKPAQTQYEVLQSSETLTMVRLQPHTGRTHQLRVHLKQLGHPIVGDALYGGKPNQRVLLHALSLEITLPNRSRQTFRAPLPPDFTHVMKELS